MNLYAEDGRVLSDTPEPGYYPSAITVEVTEEDVAHGLPGCCGWCPFALALRRAFGFDEVTVGFTYATTNAVGVPTLDRDEWVMEQSLMSQITYFDTDNGFKPGWYAIWRRG